VSSFHDGAARGPLKVGRKHLGRFFGRAFGRSEALAVADAETLEKGIEEPARQYQRGSDPAGGLEDVSEKVRS